MFILTTNPQAHTTLFTLNRPELHNALNAELIRELTVALQTAEKDSNTRVIVLAANGKNFCAGADLNEMQKTINYSQEENMADGMNLARLMHTIYQLKKPVIAAIQGRVMGGGLGLVASADIAIADNQSQFCLSEVKLGIIPAVISPYVLRAIGERAFRRYAMSAEMISANDAQHLGLVHELTAEGQSLGRALTLAAMITHNSPQAVIAVKQLIQDIAPRTLDLDLVCYTVQKLAELRTSAEGQEGLKAFLEKRKPNWY
jgi:methylglutaconyl-CoA hydratase